LPLLQGSLEIDDSVGERLTKGLTCPDCGTILRPPAVGKSNEVGPLVGVIRHRP
jgi:hypothetical protein